MLSEPQCHPTTWQEEARRLTSENDPCPTGQKTEYFFGVIMSVRVVFRHHLTQDDYLSGSQNISHQQQSF